MDPTDLDVFRLAEQRLAWVDQRQRVLAQNVANANTPGYLPRDLPPFAASLGSALDRTMPAHLAGGSNRDGLLTAKTRNRSPSGNGVSLETELSRVADTASTQELAVSLHHRYQVMMRTALGRGS